MDELELLKKQWQRQEQDLPHLSYDQLYKILLKKSSSIVKWIFMISIGEILLWTALALLVPDSSSKFTDRVGLQNIMTIANVLYYLIFITFIYLFYKNYRKISTTDSAKELMENILRTRKTVKYFIAYNIIGISIIMLGLNIYYFFNQDILFETIVKNEGMNKAMNKDQFLIIFFTTQLVVAILLIGGIWVFYRIIYGILLRRLNRNYKELEKIEV